jgi:hypothetical protein
MNELLGAAGVLVGLGIVAAAITVLELRRPVQRIHEPVTPRGPASPPHLHLGALAVLTAGAVGLQLTLADWIVEDAAISFAYAKHMAAGHGPVTYVGGEHVEGYSNPLWTFLLAAFYLVGVGGFVSNKIMAATFAAATIPITWAAARELRPGSIDGVPLLAAAFLAGSAQFAIWGAGGLENSLLSLLLAGGLWRALVEARRGGWPLSALFWLGVALTRPEGIMYAAIGGGASMVFRGVSAWPAIEHAIRTRDGSALARALWAGTWPTLAWLATFFLPFVLYQAWRMQTFAWEFPNTYYAKKGNPSKDFAPFEYSRKGWKYTREYAHKLWQGWLAPVYLLGMTGVKGWRIGFGVLGVAALAVVLLIPGPMVLQDLSWWDLREPSWFVQARVWVMTAIAAAAPLVALGRPGWRALTLSWTLAVAAVFFALYSGGDWMGGYRWFASLTVPAALVLAAGVGGLIDLIRRWEQSEWVGGTVAIGGALALLPAGLILASQSDPALSFLWPWKLGARPGALGLALSLPVLVLLTWARSRVAPGGAWGRAAWPLAVLIGGGLLVPHIQHLELFIDKPTTSPWKVQKRVNYMNWVQSRLHLEERPINLDVDMGATMYWSGDRIVDIAGLVDVSMGHHWFETPFIRQYIYQERRPHFAHVHGGWANTSRIDRLPEWKEQYIEIDPYPTGKSSTHGGNHVRKDLIVVQDWATAPSRRIPFGMGLILEGWSSPADRAPAGAHWYVEVAWSTARRREAWEDIRPVLFLAQQGKVVASWDVPPGYDWYEPHEWATGEVVVGRYSLPIPAALDPGRYDVGIAVFQETGGAIVPAGMDYQPPTLVEPDGSAPPVTWPAVPAEAVLDPTTAALVRGEVRWTQAIEVASPAAVRRAAEADLEVARQAAVEDRCQDAEDLRTLAIRRTTRTQFDKEEVPALNVPLAACWGRLGARPGDRESRVSAFELARERDAAEPTSRAAAVAFASELHQQGMQAFVQKNWAIAYPLLRDSLRVDPRQPWARRHAEQARDCSLGIRLDQHECGDVKPADLERPAAAPDAAGDDEVPEPPPTTPKTLQAPPPRLPSIKRPIPSAPLRNP